MDLIHFKKWISKNHNIEDIIEDWFWPKIWKI